MNEMDLLTKIEGLEKAIKEHKDFTLTYESNLKEVQKELEDYNKPELTPENILAYRIYASIEDVAQNPRIGLRGTAKIYGAKTRLFYYLYSVPINLTRQFVGF